MLTLHFWRWDGQRTVLAALLLAIGIFPVSVAHAGEAEVSASLNELETWLATSDHGPAWNQYLQTETLRAQLAATDGADADKVRTILARYKSDVAGLDRRRFVAVRAAMADWLVQLSLPSADDLSAAAVAAKGQFVAPSDDDIAQSHQQAVRALGELERFLNRNRARAAGWKTYLKWDDVTGALASDKPDLDALKFAADQLANDHAGLEKQRFLAARRALRQVVDRRRVLLNTAGARKTYEKYATDVAAMLKEYDSQASHYESVEIARRLGFMQRLGQGDQLIAAVRHHYAHPNLVAYINSDIATAGMETEIDEPTEVRDTIQGAYVVANGHTTGAVRATLVPDPARAVFELAMTGVTEAKAVAHARSVRVFSTSTTQLNATKRVYFSPDGLTSDPADASASSSNRFTGVSAPRQFVEKLAWKQAHKKKSSAEAEASRKAARKLRGRVDEQAAEQLSDANESYLTQFRNPLLRREAFPERFDVYTDGDAVRIKMLQATAEQLAAPSPPAAPVPDADMAVRLHESVINNFAAAFLGGVTMVSEGAPEEVVAALKRRAADVQIAKQGEGLGQFQQKRLDKVNQRRKAEGKPPLKEQTVDDDDWFAITFAQRDPVSVEFRNGTVKFTIRGVRFLGPQQVEPTSAKDTSDDFSISAAYTIAKDQYGGLTLTMADPKKDLNVIWSPVERGVKNVGLGNVGVKAKLQKRFGKLLLGENNENAVIEIFPLELPGNWAKLGELKYTVAESKGGWMSIALDRKSKEKQAAKPARPVAVIESIDDTVPKFVPPVAIESSTPVARVDITPRGGHISGN
jgi:hypothetical protein